MMTIYIISPCVLAAEGLSQLIKQESEQGKLLTTDRQESMTSSELNLIRGVIVFLPDDPFWLLKTLDQISNLLERVRYSIPVLILSRSPAAWLWDTLLHLVNNAQQLKKVCLLPTDMSCLQLSSILNLGLDNLVRLERLAEEEVMARGEKVYGLTKAELKALLVLLSGVNIKEEANRMGLSKKTLYTQRIAGIKKIIECHPHFSSLFPHTQLKSLSSNSMTTFEMEFIQAIYNRDIYPVFQPIVDDNLQLKGFEVLVRWRNDNRIILPGQFLPLLHHQHPWLVLTAYIFLEAVECIKRYKGIFYFSVNIPAAIATSEKIINMLAVIQEKLPREWMNKLVLEFSETTDFRQQTDTADNILQLQERGFVAMLDDCFSKGSVFFPARTLNFDAYKLDMSIIDDAKDDPQALALIKSLIFYCRLSNRGCVAEGIDSFEKFSQLKKIGVDSFQGYFISPPVNKNYLKEIILRYSQPE